jgi:MEMO1 family protein
MTVRTPSRAGMFYEADPGACRRHVEELLAGAKVPDSLPPRLYGGVVPHAGWVYSGRLAALTFKALAASSSPKTFVLFGADHTGAVKLGEVYASGAWLTPLGEVPIDEQLAQAVLAAGGSCCRANADAHVHEHSIEVQIPLLQVVAPEARILPIGVAPSPMATDIARAVAEAIGDRADEVAIVASTDLSHHGGHFPAPGGRGEIGEQWARENDRRVIDLAEAMDAESILPETCRHMNACGPGALAAAIAACKALGATKGICLDYTNSYVITHEQYPHELDDTTVGYASIVFG